MPRHSLASIVALLLLAALPAGAVAAPSCSDGPEIVGNQYIGTPCDDTIRMPRSITVAHGEGGDDTIYGQRGNDRLFGGPGDDRLYGGIGDDQLLGGPDDDLLSGGFGADSVLDGEGGNDFVRGDATIDDIQNTGGGTDTLSYATGVTPGFFDRPSPPYSFPDFSVYENFPQTTESRGAYVNLAAGRGDNGLAPDGGGFDVSIEDANEFEIVIGTAFADYIVGTSDDQTIYGGGGADVILGEGGEDDIYGGEEGDYCDAEASEGATTAGCEFDGDDKEVEPRPSSTIRVGEMAPAAGRPPALYLTGSDGNDTLAATYSSGQTALIANGTPRAVISGLPDSVLIAGLAGDDTLTAQGFPATTSVVLLGGEDEDGLSGGATEDALVDGPGDDTADAAGGDDAVPNNEGADDLDAGPGEDLFVSDAVCDGDVLDGGPDRDNANWANFGEGVTIDMGAGKAGRVGGEGQAECPDPSLLTDLANLEDIEGTSHGDVMVGDSGPNQLLGRPGQDSYFAAAGNDHILANSGDGDAAIECGSGWDTALVDIPTAGYEDPEPVDCEDVEERPVNSFRPPNTPPDPDPPPEERDDGEPVTAPPPPPAGLPVPPWLLDRVPPRTRFAHRPERRVFTPHRWRKVVFVFAASERARFLCKLDRRPLRPCGRIRRYWLRPGRHALRARAVDRAGNRDRSFALHRFVIRRVSARWIRTHRRPGPNR